MEEKTDEVCDKCGSPMVIKWGRYGKFLACSGYPECKNTRQMAGGEGDRRARAARGRGQGGLPQRRPAHGAEEGPLRPLPRLHQLSRVQGHQAAGARGGRASSRSRRWRPSTRSAPSAARTSCGAAGASAPSSPAATTRTASTSRRRKPRRSASSARTAARARWWSGRAAGAASFYGCRRYPECKFTAYHRPIAEPCPDCGRAYLLEKETKKEGKVIFCGNEACHYKREAA